MADIINLTAENAAGSINASASFTTRILLAAVENKKKVNLKNLLSLEIWNQIDKTEQKGVEMNTIDNSDNIEYNYASEFLCTKQKISPEGLPFV